MGGYPGLASNSAFATEYQGEATPHGHGFVTLPNMYQHNNLEEISNMLQKNHSLLTDVEKFVEHVQREDHYNSEQHAKDLPNLEKEFKANNNGPTRNVHLSTRPSFMYTAKGSPYLWNGTFNASDRLEWQKIETKAANEAVQYKKKYETDVQFIFSHVQHHWHELNEKGDRVPMKYCKKKGRKKDKQCKRGFPKKVLRDKKGALRKDKYRVRLICPGVAKELDLKTSGRRNALGSIAGKRSCEYFAPTSGVLAAVTRSNTNVQCNYRLPIIEITHDKDCTSSRCRNEVTQRRLSIVAQRAMKQMTQYFGGYIGKRQKIGRFEMKKSIGALQPFKEKLHNRNLRSASAQLSHVCNRMFVVLEGKGILRMLHMYSYRL